MAKADLIPVERIEKAILLIRGQKVLLDHDLARLYEVPTKRLRSGGTCGAFLPTSCFS
jgi:ORF6N domain